MGAWVGVCVADERAKKEASRGPWNALGASAPPPDPGVFPPYIPPRLVSLFSQPEEAADGLGPLSIRPMKSEQEERWRLPLEANPKWCVYLLHRSFEWYLHTT